MASTQHQDITDWQEASLPFIYQHHFPHLPSPPHTSEYNNLDSTHHYEYDDNDQTHHIGITLPPILPLQPTTGTNNNNNQQSSSSSSTQPPPPPPLGRGGGGGGGGVKLPKTSSSSPSQRTQPKIPKFNENLAAQQLVSTLTGGPVKKGGGVASSNATTAGTKAPTSTTNNNNSNNSIHRGLLLLRLPKPGQKHFDRLPAAVCDPSGQPCLLILPSDKPANRQEAIAVEQFVSRSMGTPSRAAETAALWRRKLLSEKCGAAMTTLRQDSPAGWFVKQSEKCGTNNSSQKRGSSIGRTSTTATTTATTTTTTTTTTTGSSFQKKTKTAGTSYLDTIGEVSGTTTTSGHLTLFSPLCSTKVPSLLSATTSRLSSLGTGTGTAVFLLGNDTSATSMGWAGTCRGSMTAALTVAMAEVIRQVEVSCAERARVLIKLWNAMLELTDGAMKEGMEADGVRVMRENAVLSAEVATLRGDARDVNELQLQVARLEKEMEELKRKWEEEKERKEEENDDDAKNIITTPANQHIIDGTLGLIDFSNF